ncbi:MAG: aminotransferase class I/II-fold pyridoxal phosphate-dependent enzyme [Chloroflexi bacterium]|nr:aminotransferase class I/II-fold pyridoxal phosphate-dependent enzyme [Chloroflexota bacterium]MCI0580888.1 aminotransferase class I/II-fold pyridoxal phosphate-dependent enzyme [Chloroflexota bacterium]MCI0649736.1 aminotransferase class I/II-fold pyridoxal phosphate-dependent enzyme [Chloroflexota bacterium]MCI0725475.1 aminotransferase class I/II-fold pyridoxal phosphate-dependent enzyme [Chloroflexota bacterium]
MIHDTTTQVPALTPASLWDVDFYKEQGVYFYLEEVQEILPNGRVMVAGHGEMIMLGSYSYLGLIGHPKINQAAREAVDKYGTGTHGVRLLAGTLAIHNQLEAKIAEFKRAEAAVTFSSGYVTNVAVISSLLRKGDTVICDKLNHASIVDGCLLSQARFLRFRHNDMEHLERRLADCEPALRKLVIVDAVFSMDGDIINLPEVSRLCRQYGAYLMVDEAHSIGVLGETGHGIEEHFDLPPDSVDIKMGTLSKTVPSAGGYAAGSRELCQFLKHEARGFIFSAALPPASAAASLAAFEVIEEEPERIQKLRRNFQYLAGKLRAAGFDLLNTETAIIPVMCFQLEKAALLAKYCQDRGIFVQAIVAPVVPEGQARLRATVSANHSLEDLDYCVEALTAGAKEIGGILR